MVALDAAYARGRDLHRTHGRSYYLATALLPAAKRPHVHALYGFTRRADTIVDELVGPADTAGPARPVAARRAELDAWGAGLRDALAGRPVADPLLLAIASTVRATGMDPADLTTFLASMAMDLTVTSYATYADLLRYMEGSAAVIGTLMLPILGLARGGDAAVARAGARELGLAFQLTNFIRDVGEDCGRGRVYLPVADLRAYGLDRERLFAEVARGSASSALRALIAFECERARAHYRAALPGLAQLPPRSRLCIRAAYLLYRGILDEVARADFDVLRQRAVVPTRRRVALLTRSLLPLPTAS